MPLNSKPLIPKSSKSQTSLHLAPRSLSTQSSPMSPDLSQALPGPSTKPSKSKGRTKKPRPPPTSSQFPISASYSQLTPEEKDCLVKAMALPVGDHIASRGRRIPDNVLEEIREDQNTIALAQRVLEHPHKGKGKATDMLEPSRNMLTTIAEWLKQESTETERCLKEMAESNSAASHSNPSPKESSTSQVPLTSSTSKTPSTPNAKPSRTKRKPRKKQTPESPASAFKVD